MAINIMEVCGTHTMAIAEHGLKKLFASSGINLISGPGCPVCVTPKEKIDEAIEISRLKGVTIATFGDMVHVPGTSSSLAGERSKGSDIRVVYSAHDALELANGNPGREIVFLGAGFETTSPTVAATVITAKNSGIKNFSVLSMFKTIPNALKAILKIKKRKIHGFLLPGHVSAVIGSKPYEFISKKYGIPGVIAGFGANDIITSVRMLSWQIRRKKPQIEIQYSTCVSKDGNPQALKILGEVFKTADSNWRAVGRIPLSGLEFKKKYSSFDALKRFKVKVQKTPDPKNCLCGQILLGLKNPAECKLFGKSCTPNDPIGPCMVSGEGACAAEYKYAPQTN